MADKQENAFDGFTMLSDMLIGGNPEDSSSTTNVGNEIPEVDPEDILNDDSNEDQGGSDNNDDQDGDDQSQIENDSEDQNQDDNDDDEDIGIDTDDDNSEESDSNEDDNQVEDLSEFEEDISKFLKSKLESDIGIDFPEDADINSVSDIVSYLDELVTEASKPKYANQDIEKLDEYVKNGGDIKKFYADVYDQQLDIDNVDMENESDQKKILRLSLKEQGISDSLIDKKITRWEESGVLADEAEEAYDVMKSSLTKKEEKLLEEQKKQKAEYDKKQQDFLNNVEETISQTKDIRGINIPKKEKQELLDYIFKPTKSGMTKYQEDYMSDIKNLIESAYFTKNGDSLINKVRNQASSQTTKNLQNKLKNKKNKRLNSGSDNLSSNTKSDNGLASLSKLLIG